MKDHSLNSKIPKFDAKRINSLRFIAVLKYKNFQRNVWLPDTCAKLSVTHTVLRKLLCFKTAINRKLLIRWIPNFGILLFAVWSYYLF